jgi:hypothetical protein
MKIMKIAIALVTILGCAALTSCDPKKPGGGGLPQKYDGGDGKYK